MNTTQLIGEVGLTEQPQETGFQSGRGWFCTRTFTGARSRVNAFILTALPPFYSDLHLTEEGEKATLTVTYGIVGPGNNQVTDPVSVIWTMPNNDQDETIFALPEVDAIFSELSNETATAMALDINQGINDGKKLSDFDWLAYLLNAEQIETMQSVYARLARGVSIVRISKYVLRKVETVIAESQIKAAHTNVNRAFTYAQLIASEPTLPSAPLLDASSLQGYFWVKETPVIDSSARGHFQIIQQYLGSATKPDTLVNKPAV